MYKHFIKVNPEFFSFVLQFLSFLYQGITKGPIDMPILFLVFL